MALVSSAHTQREPTASISLASSSATHNGLSALKVAASPPKMDSASASLSPEEANALKSSNQIVGPDGRLHTQGEAARLGLIIRTACESCRNRKLKCSGTLPQDGGCERCSTDSITCLYSARAPIGRPKKRKSEGETEESESTPKTRRQKPKTKQETLSPLATIDKTSAAPQGSENSTPSSSSHRSPHEDLLSSGRHSLNEAVSDCAEPSLPGTHLSNSWPYSQQQDDALFSFPQASTAGTASTSQQIDSKLPSLDDLSIAAFLQSLDTLEISPEELLRQQQQTAHRQIPPLNGSSFPNPGYSSAMNAVGLPTSLEEWASSSAILQPGLSFAVPADFSWWDLGIGADPADSGNPSTAATPAIERPHPFMSPVTVFSDRNAAGHGLNGINTDVVVPSQPERSPTSPSRKYLSNQNWPRGATAGMGQGQIQQTHAASEGGLGWSTFAVPAEKTPSVSSLSDSSAKPDGCCSRNEAQIKVEPGLPACCDNKAEQADTGINGTTALPLSTSPGAGLAKEPKSCCSGKAKDASLAETTAISVDKKPAMQHEHPSKVHCVPNPSGKGCTCLCDMSVALLSVKQVLRETDPSKQTQTQPRQSTGAKPDNSFASNTIQLTLTASQAITAQCACSTDCPTCQSDPSTEISASLLVSTALQIYARAVRILREGFASSAGHASGGYSSSSAANAFFGGLEVTIGSYKPSSSNAKKIALFAIKLELKDLRRALGKVSRMAQDFNTQTGESTDGLLDEHDRFKSMNPIDQLVIFKLYRQLTELLKTVEGLEDVA